MTADDVESRGDRETETGLEAKAREAIVRAFVGRLLFPVGYFLRNGLVLWAAGLVATAEIAAMAQRGLQWRGDLVWTIDWLPVSFILVGPVVAGFSAMDTARTATGALHLFRNPVSRTPAFAIAVSYTVILGLTHLFVLVGALVLSAPPVGDDAAPLAVLCQVLILAFFSALGTAAGRFVGPVLAGVSGALAAFGMVYLLSAPSRHLMLLEIGGATIPRIGYAYSASYLGYQSVALLFAIAALLVLRPLEGRRRRQVTWGDTAVACVLVAGVVAISFTVRSDRLAAVDAQPTYCGAVSAVPTCFYPQHRRVAEAFQEQFWILVESARENGYGDLLPAKVEEASRTQLPQKADVRTAAFYVMPDHLQGARPTLQEIALGIVQPLHCRQVQGETPPSERYWTDLQALTGTWVNLADPGEAQRMGYMGKALTPKEAAEMLKGFRTCTYPHF
jgi:hypothetical protein